MHIPANCKSLAEAKEPQIRLGIQGSPKSGKTWGALTFPNPVVLNLDRGLGAHMGRADVIEIPAWDDAYCRSVNPNHKGPATLIDTVKFIMDKEIRKLEEDQTFVFDGGTGLQNAYHRWYESNKVVSSSGKFDEFAQWRLKIDMFGDFCERIKTLKCHVIYICHESERKEKSGDYLGKIRPLLTGQFVDQLASHFTDWVRQLSNDKPKDLTTIDDKILLKWGLTKAEFGDMCSHYPRNTIYYWQLESDDIFDGGVSSLVNFPRFIPANYESFKRYMKK